MGAEQRYLLERDTMASQQGLEDTYKKSQKRYRTKRWIVWLKRRGENS